jgi:GNAT superfamily N-acetyltransferase
LVAGLVVLISTGLLIPRTYRDWNYLQGWSFAQNWTKAAWLIVPALCAGMLVYLAAEAWIRVSLLRELKRLRKRSAGWSPAPEEVPPREVEVVRGQQAGEAAGDSVTVLSRLSEWHIVQLHELYQREWWSKGRSLDATRRGVKGSQVVVGLVNGSNELVAFARVLTDYTFKALIFDVIVADASRNQQLGRKLMNLVTGHEALREVRHFELYCLPELVGFYVPHGFSTDVGNIVLMRRVCPDA